MKKCSRCGIEKHPVDDFYLINKNKNWRRNICKRCMSNEYNDRQKAGREALRILAAQNRG